MTHVRKKYPEAYNSGTMLPVLLLNWYQAKSGLWHFNKNLVMLHRNKI
jgi:hypothetical protein